MLAGLMARLEGVQLHPEGPYLLFLVHDLPSVPVSGFFDRIQLLSHFFNLLIKIFNFCLLIFRGCFQCFIVRVNFNRWLSFILTFVLLHEFGMRDQLTVVNLLQLKVFLLE